MKYLEGTGGVELLTMIFVLSVVIAYVWWSELRKEQLENENESLKQENIKLHDKLIDITIRSTLD